MEPEAYVQAFKDAVLFGEYSASEVIDALTDWMSWDDLGEAYSQLFPEEEKNAM